MTEEEIDESEIAQAEKFGLGDLVIAAIIAVVVYCFQALFAYSGIHPGVWDDATVAAWVRPAAHVMPGYWTACAQLVYKTFGLAGGEGVFRLLGHLSLAFLAFCAYSIMREGFALIMRARPQLSKRRPMVSRLASSVGAIAFVMMDPVWAVGQCLSETTILLVLTMLPLILFFRFLRKGRLAYAYLGSVFLGFLGAETPFGLLLPLLLIALYMYIATNLPNLESPLFKPAVLEIGKWHMTFLYFVALLSGMALNCWTFVSHGGVGAIGETLGHVPLAYALGYWDKIVSSAGLVPWLTFLAACLVPFVVTIIRFPAATDEEKYLPYATGLIIFVCSVLAFSQTAFLPVLWFWTHFPVNSQYLLSFGLFFCAFTLACGVATLGVDSLCRNHTNLAKTIYGEEDDDLAQAKASRSTKLVRRFGVVLMPVFLVAMMVPARFQTTTRMMLDVVGDGIREFVKEAGDAHFLFSDGALDAAIELESAKGGGSLRCYSLMGGGGAMAGYLRTRGLTEDSEDKFAFGFDSAMGLRSWIRDRPERLSDTAVMMGFDLWKRDGKPLPPFGGLLSRPAGYASEEARKAEIKAAYALAERVLAIHRRRGGIKACTDEPVRRAFVAVQWRLARMCTYRSEADDLAGLVDDAIAETKLAKELNDLNPTYKLLLDSIEKQKELMMKKVTPREGLQLALVRADFTMGKVYAETVLGSDPVNPDANFAMGMYYLERRQLSMAESYLRRCLVRKPNEPSVYNNLAMIQIDQRRFDAAERNVRKALELLPNSAAVLDTKKALEKARKEASAKK